MSQQLHDMKNIFCSVILHTCFEMAKGLERNLKDSRVLELQSNTFSLILKVASKIV